MKNLRSRLPEWAWGILCVIVGLITIPLIPLFAIVWVAGMIGEGILGDEDSWDDWA
jgi:hypothetical protein